MKTAVSARKWLIRRPWADADARLFCFPYSGVGASMYGAWPDRIGSLGVCPVQLPARENRIGEPHFGTYEDLAEAAAEALEPYLDRPYAFFGHCGGALAAFATARRLERAGRGPACLFVSSEVAPHEGPFGRFLEMSRDELGTEIAGLAVAMGGRLDPDSLELALEVLERDVEANRRFKLDAAVRLGCALYAIGWDRDDEIRPEQMTGWREYVEPEDFHPVTLRGEHHSFLTAPTDLLAVFEAGLGDSPESHSEVLIS